MSKSTDTTTTPLCGSCVNMREEDGYCGRVGRYVNYFRKACKGYVDRNDVEATIAAAPPAKPNTRTCKQCGRELPLEQFTRSCKSRDGYTHTCKECFSAQMSEKKKALWASKPKKEKPVQEQEVLPEGQKRCRRCGRILPVTAFGRHATTPDHLHPTCTECRKAEGRAVYERNCARKGITPKPPRVDVPKEDNEATKIQIIINDLEKRLALLEGVQGDGEGTDYGRGSIDATKGLLRFVWSIRDLKDVPMLPGFMERDGAIKDYSDQALVDELRARGWTITATKEL